MNVKKLLIGAAGLAAAASLIGLGAGASFSDSASASQQVSTGTVALQAQGADGGWASSVWLAPIANLNSAGVVTPQTVNIYNAGSLPALMMCTLPVVDQSAGLTGITASVSSAGIKSLAPGGFTTVTVAYTKITGVDLVQGQAGTYKFTVTGSDVC